MDQIIQPLHSCDKTTASHGLAW